MNLTSRQKIFLGVGFTSIVIIIVSILLGTNSSIDTTPSSGNGKGGTGTGSTSDGSVNPQNGPEITSNPQSSPGITAKPLNGNGDAGTGTGNVISQNSGGNSSPNVTTNNSPPDVTTNNSPPDVITTADNSNNDSGNQNNSNNSLDDDIGLYMFSDEDEDIERILGTNTNGSVNNQNGQENNQNTINQTGDGNDQNGTGTNPLISNVAEPEISTNNPNPNSSGSGSSATADANNGANSNANQSGNNGNSSTSASQQTSATGNNKIELKTIRCGKDKQNLCGKYDLKLAVPGVARHVSIFYALEDRSKIEELKRKIGNVLAISPREATLVIQRLGGTVVPNGDSVFGVSGFDTTSSSITSIYEPLMTKCFIDYITNLQESGDQLLKAKDVLFVIPNEDPNILKFRLSPPTQQRNREVRQLTPQEAILQGVVNQNRAGNIKLTTVNCGKDDGNVCGMYEVKYRGITDVKYKIFYGLVNTEENLQALKKNIFTLVSSVASTPENAFENRNPVAAKIDGEDAYLVSGLVDNPTLSYGEIYNQILKQGFLNTYKNFMQKDESEKILKAEDFVVIIPKTAEKFYQLGLEAPAVREGEIEVVLNQNECGKDKQNICGEYVLEFPGESGAKYKIVYAVENLAKLNSLKNLIENVLSISKDDTLSVFDGLDVSTVRLNDGGVFGLSGLKNTADGKRTAEGIYEDLQAEGLISYLPKVQAKNADILKNNNILFVIPGSDANYAEFILGKTRKSDDMINLVLQQAATHQKPPQTTSDEDSSNGSENESVDETPGEDYGLIEADKYNILYKCANKKKLNDLKVKLAGSEANFAQKKYSDNPQSLLSKLWGNGDSDNDDGWSDSGNDKADKKTPMKEEDEAAIFHINKADNLVFNQIIHRSFKEYMLDLGKGKDHERARNAKNIFYIFPTKLLADRHLHLDVERKRIDLEGATGTAMPAIEVILDKNVDKKVKVKGKYSVKIQRIKNLFKQEGLFGLSIEYSTPEGSMMSNEEFESYESFANKEHVTIYDQFTVVHDYKTVSNSDNVVSILDEIKNQGASTHFEKMNSDTNRTHFSVLLVTKNEEDFAVFDGKLA